MNSATLRTSAPKRIVGIIPARGGSKSILRKNLALLNGRPLLAYACEAALASSRLDRVVVNTDDQEIAAVARAHGVEVPFLRPAELAEDSTLVVHALAHMLRWFESEQRYRPDAIALIQPTSPLRRAEHVDAAVDLFVSSGADTVVTVIPVPHQFNPTSVLRLDGHGCLVPFVDGPQILRRQDKPAVFARNGPAVLVMRREDILAGRLYGPLVRPLEMKPEDSVDIDSAADIALAEFWLRWRQEHTTS